MRGLDIGWSTDVAVLMLSGSSVDDRGDHLVVRTPANPTFHWGNCILVTDPAAAGDADRWVQVFGATFPSATWVAIGLPRLPKDTGSWAAHDLELEVDEVLVASTVPHQTTRPDGVTVRRLTGDDWEQDVALAIAENGRTGDYENHRRRGLASQLLGVAARWAASFGCDRWVIVTEATNPAKRVYQRLGLEPHTTHVQAYRQR